MCAGALRRHCSRHDQGRVTHTEVRRLHRRRQHHVHGAARSRHRVPRAQRSRQVHDDAGHGRAHPADVRHRDDRRTPVRRTAQHGPGGRRPPRRLRAARGPHRPRDPHPRPADHGPAPEPGGRDAGAGQPHADRSGSPRAQLLAGHAAAPRDRHRADRRAGGPDPRRAGQRPRPGRHPLDARPSPRLRRPGRHRAAVVAPVARDRGDRRRPGRDRQRPDRRAGHQGGAPADRAGTYVRATGQADLAGALTGSGVEFTRSGDGFRTDADPEHVGKVALAAGVPLVELRTADGAGLEDMFLELTADTSREGAAA